VIFGCHIYSDALDDDFMLQNNHMCNYKTSEKTGLDELEC
jgi:hypothetical protein